MLRARACQKLQGISLTLGTLFAFDTDTFTGDLDQNFLSGSPYYEIIDMSHNQFTSTNGLPSQVFAKPSLVVLDLAANALSGSLPENIPINNVLHVLALYENDLSGSIPANLRNLAALDHLDVSDNQFSGPMPGFVGNMVRLSFLFLSNNPFSPGPTPTEFSQLGGLRELSLRNTGRTGNLPAFLGDSVNLLDLLDLSSNDFTGPIPESFGNLQFLSFLLLNDNNGITGEIPSSLDRLIRLKAAYLDGTSLGGTTDVLCGLPNFEQMEGIEVIYADCQPGDSGAEIECSCNCECCPSGNDNGCSQPDLSNLDIAVENGFRRQYYEDFNFGYNQSSSFEGGGQNTEQ